METKMSTPLPFVDGQEGERDIDREIDVSTLVPRAYEPIAPPENKYTVEETEEGEKENERELRVFQLNCLSDFLASQDCFTRVGPAEINFDAGRKQRLLADILRHDADIICLQEVDHFFDWFYPKLTKHGYQASYTKKPMGEDGSCIFWKEETFRCEFTTSYQFVNPKYESVDNQLQVIAYLVQKETKTQIDENNNNEMQKVSEEGSENTKIKKHLLVSTTHLKAAKSLKGEIIRTYQAVQCCENLEKLASQLGNPPLLLTGDLNAAPFDKEEYQATCVSKFVEAQFYSAYDITNPQLFTTWKFRSRTGIESESKHMIDYIFFKNGNNENKEEGGKGEEGGEGEKEKRKGGIIVPTSLLSLPSEEVLGSTGLPSFKHPSDHLSIGMGFLLK